MLVARVLAGDDEQVHASARGLVKTKGKRFRHMPSG